MEIFDALRHAVRGAGAGGADLQHAAMDLHVECQDMAAQVGEHARLAQNVPECRRVLWADIALVGAGEAVDRMDGMVARDELVAGVRVLVQHGAEPVGLDMAFAAEARPQRVNEDEQQVALPHPVRQAFLSGRPVARQVIVHLAEHRLAHGVVGRMVAGRVPQRGRAPVEPGHLVVEPVSPLLAQRVGIGRVARDLVAEKQDELGRWRQAPKGRVDAGEGALVRGAGNAGAGVAIEDELMPLAARQQGVDRLATCGPLVVAFDLVFLELHEAVARVETVGLAAIQHFQAHRQTRRIGFGEKRLQDLGAESGIVQSAVEVERVDLDFMLEAPEPHAADALTAQQDQPHSRSVEMLAEYSACARRLVTEDALQMLAHDLDTQRQKRLEVHFADWAEAPVFRHVKRSSRCAAWRPSASPWCRVPSIGRGGRH